MVRSDGVNGGNRTKNKRGGGLEGNGGPKGEEKREKARNVRVTHHFVFVLVPPGRIRGSNNLCVCEETAAIARGRSRRGERRGGEHDEKFSER